MVCGYRWQSSLAARFLDTPQVACYKPTAFSADTRVVRASFPMLSAYIPIAIFVVVATGFAIFTMVFSGLLHPQKYNQVKLEPYECGIEPLTDARHQADGQGERQL